MFIDQLSNAGSLPVAAAAMRFAAQRQQLIAHNIANFETPNFQPMDVSPASFQQSLRDAVEQRCEANGGSHGTLSMRRTSDIEPGQGGSLVLKPGRAAGGVLAHDRNASDLELTMQALVENAAAFRVAADLMRVRAGVLKRAIGEQVS